MKKFLKPLLLIPMFIIASSCNDDSQTTEPMATSVTQSNLTNKLADCSLVTEGKDKKWEDIDPLTVAKLHNEYLEKPVTIALQDRSKSDIEVLSSLEIPNVTSDYITCITTKVSNTSMKKWIGLLLQT